MDGLYGYNSVPVRQHSALASNIGSASSANKIASPGPGDLISSELDISAAATRAGGVVCTRSGISYEYGQ